MYCLSGQLINKYHNIVKMPGILGILDDKEGARGTGGGNLMRSANKYLTRLISWEDQDLNLLTLTFFIRLEIILSS